ncbi:MULTISPECIES: type II secretion system protein [unclassified Clostridium]|uniref:type II secretion system protein n=1 Tax=unclassified Clostridium TaxID=2614128 RepID=UPI003216E818
MIKRANNKKKKGFTLIELIIVLAVMAIIALIAIPNFSAVRDNSKVKADKQSCETIERTVLMLVSDETIKGDGKITYAFTDKGVLDDTNTTVVSITDSEGKDCKSIIKEALKEVKAPQAAPGFEKVTKATAKATTYEITIGADGSVKANTK